MDRKQRYKHCLLQHRGAALRLRQDQDEHLHQHVAPLGLPFPQCPRQSRCDAEPEGRGNSVLEPVRQAEDRGVAPASFAAAAAKGVQANAVPQNSRHSVGLNGRIRKRGGSRRLMGQGAVSRCVRAFSKPSECWDY